MLLDDLVSKSIYIIREAVIAAERANKNIAMLWSTGKDSTTTLYLARQVKPDIFVIHLDTGFKFPEIYEFRDRLAEEWNLNLVVKRRNTNVTPFNSDRFTCCMERKTKALREVIDELDIGYLIVSIRNDEHVVRGKERHFSPRYDADALRMLQEAYGEDAVWMNDEIKKQAEEGGWIYLDQPVELWDLYQTDFPGAHHVRVHPLLDWPLEAVWEFIKREKIPMNPLYLQGYSSLGCWPCTQRTMTPSKTIDEFIEKVKSVEERGGRAQDKEDVDTMLMLRKAGYP